MPCSERRISDAMFLEFYNLLGPGLSTELADYRVHAQLCRLRTAQRSLGASWERYRALCGTSRMHRPQWNVYGTPPCIQDPWARAKRGIQVGLLFSGSQKDCIGSVKDCRECFGLSILRIAGACWLNMGTELRMCTLHSDLLQEVPCQLMCGSVSLQTSASSR